VTPDAVVTPFVTGIDTTGLAFGPDGNLYAAHFINFSSSGSVYRVSPDGTVSTFATGMYGPTGLAFDSSGNLYVAEFYGNDVSEVTPDGTVSTFATGIMNPVGLAFDGSGNLYVASQTGGYVDEITPDGTVSTFATGFATPVGLAFDSTGNLYVAESDGNKVSKITPDGVVSTFATGFSGRPEYIGFDSSGNLFVPEYDNGVLSVVGPEGGTGRVFATGFRGAEAVAFVPTTEATTTFDANADFEAGWAAGTNPNGVWSYGRTTDLGGPLVLFTRNYVPAINNGLEHMWDDPNDSAGATPSVARNSGGDFNNGNVTFRAGALILHPCGVDGHDYAHVVFTAPSDGSYSLAGDFFAQQNNINVDVHVLVNGASVFDSTITSNGVSRPFSGTFGLSAGDTIDFTVGPNGNFVPHAGNTGLDATITTTPQGAGPVTSSLAAGAHKTTVPSTSDSPSFLDGSTASPLVQTVPPGLGTADTMSNPASSPGAPLPVQSPGTSLPGNDFRFTGGRYRYNLDTTGPADGTYSLYFTVDGDPLIHSVSFIVG
jgi:sugar lactone lactonase YvrE